MGPSLTGLNASWAQMGGGPIAVLEPPPSSVSASGITASTAIAAWVRASANETGFVVQVEEPSGSGNWVSATGDANPAGPGVTSFNMTGIIGPLFKIRVATLSALGTSAFTDSPVYGLDNGGSGGGSISGSGINVSWAMMSAAPFNANPSAPASLLAVITGQSTYSLSWFDTSSNETGFEVQVEESFGSGNWVNATGEANATAPDVTSYNGTGAVGPIVGFRVRALGGTLPSAWATIGPYGLDNIGSGGGSIATGYTAMMAAVERGRDVSSISARKVFTYAASMASLESGKDSTNIDIGFSQTYAALMASMESGSDRTDIRASIASTLVNGGFLAALAAEFTEQRSAVGLFIEPAQVLQCAIRAARFYAGWATLDDVSAQRGVFSITGSTYVLPGEWAIISPLFVLYVERESAVAIESSRVAGVDAVGRDSSTVEADIRQLEADLPQLAYVEPVWSVGFCAPDDVNLCGN